MLNLFLFLNNLAIATIANAGVSNATLFKRASNEFCWKSCPDSDQNGALCYPACADGYRGAGPVCWESCADGYHDDGAFCRRPWPLSIYAKKSYGRGAGEPLKCPTEAPPVLRSNWMGEMAPIINNRYLYQIDLPGAHHAGFSSVEWYDKVGELFSKCQNKGITELLNQGNRYLDLRIGEMRGTIYFTHTIASKQKLEDGLKEINTWIRANPTEILILDIVNDSDFKPVQKTTSATQKLPALLQEMFGDLRISPRDYARKSYKQLVQSNKRVAIVGNAAYSNGIPKVSSWSKTQSGNWGVVVDNCERWIKTEGVTNIKNRWISVVSASVSPKPGQDISPPVKVTRETHQLLRKRLPNIPGRIGVIEMDFVEDETVQIIIEHNKLK